MKFRSPLRAAQWQQHLQTWQNSDQTQVAYCRAHGLSVQAFQYWRRKFPFLSSNTIDHIDQNPNAAPPTDTDLQAPPKASISSALPAFIALRLRPTPEQEPTNTSVIGDTNQSRDAANVRVRDSVRADHAPSIAHSAPSALTLHIGQHYRIDVMPDFHATTLRQLLSVLEAA